MRAALAWRANRENDMEGVFKRTSKQASKNMVKWGFKEVVQLHVVSRLDLKKAVYCMTAVISETSKRMRVGVGDGEKNNAAPRIWKRLEEIIKAIEAY